MKIIVNNEQTKNKELCYEEGFWTGKRTIKYDGVTLTKIKRNLYEYKNGESVEQFEVKGNQFYGITITMFGNNVEIVRRLTWYEIVMSVVVFVPGVLFGAVGGVIGALIGITNLIVIRKVNKWWLQLIISLVFTAVCLVLSYVVALLLLKAIS